MPSLRAQFLVRALAFPWARRQNPQPPAGVQEPAPRPCAQPACRGRYTSVLVGAEAVRTPTFLTGQPREIAECRISAGGRSNPFRMGWSPSSTPTGDGVNLGQGSACNLVEPAPL